MSDVYQSHAERMAALIEQANEQEVRLQRIQEQGQRRLQQATESVRDCDRLHLQAHPRVWTPSNADQSEPVWQPE